MAEHGQSTPKGWSATRALVSQCCRLAAHRGPARGQLVPRPADPEAGCTATADTDQYPGLHLLKLREKGLASQVPWGTGAWRACRPPSLYQPPCPFPVPWVLRGDTSQSWLPFCCKRSRTPLTRMGVKITSGPAGHGSACELGMAWDGPPWSLELAPSPQTLGSLVLVLRHFPSPSLGTSFACGPFPSLLAVCPSLGSSATQPQG